MSNPFSLEGRTALVTGANRGLGRAFADAMADAGADVVVVGRHEDRNREAATEIAARLSHCPGPDHVRERAFVDVRPVAESRADLEP